METNSRSKLLNQIKENYGRVLYTYTAHIKMAQRLNRTYNRMKVLQIILSAFSGSALFSLMFNDVKIVAIIGTVISIGLVIVTSVSKNFSFIERSNQHIRAHEYLYKIKEDYISLITDFDELDIDKIRRTRDHLIEKTDFANKNYPKTDKKAYADAQNAIQKEEEQSFGKNEIDKLLPISEEQNN